MQSTESIDEVAVFLSQHEARSRAG
jgi:hypothetical protein